MLNANRRVVCPACTIDTDQPVLVDGTKWEMHQRSRGHRKMTGKDKKAPRHIPSEVTAVVASRDGKAGS